MPRVGSPHRDAVKRVSARKDQRTPQYGPILLAEFPFGLIYRLPRRRDELLMNTRLVQQKTFGGNVQ